MENNSWSHHGWHTDTIIRGYNPGIPVFFTPGLFLNTEFRIAISGSRNFSVMSILLYISTIYQFAYN